MANEQDRIDFLVRRDGEAAAIEWVRRTSASYRRAVLDEHHFASGPMYRREFIQSYCVFKRWLAAVGASATGDAPR